MPHDSTARFLRFRDHGDLAALGAVFDEFAPKLLGLALHLCGQVADAEDLVQRSFVVAIEKAASFDATRAVGPWLTGILTKEAQNLRRQRERRVEAGARIDPRAVEHDCVGASDAATTIETRELVEILRTRVDALPQEQRQVLLLQVQHGLSPVEIAEALGLAPGTVRMRLHRGLRALRKLLPQGLTPSLPVLFEGRGLARVREAVLAAGRTPVSTVAATALWITPSLWIMKNALVVLVGLVCALLFFVGRSLFVQSPPSEATSTPVSAGAEVEGTSGTASSPNTSTADEGTRQAKPATNAKAAVRVRLRGHVRDAARQEGDDVLLPGADVTLWRSPRDPSQVEVIAARAQTSAIAPLRFDALDPGAYRITVHFATRLQHEAICELVAGREEQVDVEVTIFGRVHGHVVDEALRPLPGVDVLVGQRHRAGVAGDLVRRVGRSAADGSFAAFYLAEDEYIAAADGRRVSSRSHPLQQLGTFALDDEPVRLVLEGEGTVLRGSVVDELGVALQGVDVHVQEDVEHLGRDDAGAWVGPRLPVHCKSDAQGRFEARGLPRGRVRVFASHLPWASSEQAIDLDIDAAEVRLVLARRARLSGFVRDEHGQGLRGFFVSLRQGPSWMTSVTRPDGSFRFDGVDFAPFAIVAQHTASSFSTGLVDKPAPTQLEQRVDIEVGPVRVLRGSAVDASGRALAGFRITCTQSVEGRAASSPEERVIETHEDGSFVLWGLAAGPHVVRLFAPGGQGTPSALAEARVEADSDELRLVAPSGARLFGRLHGSIVDDRGRPLDGLIVHLASKVAPQFAASTRLVAGAFRFDDLPLQNLQLSLQSDDHVVVARSFDFTKQRDREVRIVAARASTLRVAFRRIDGQPWTERPPVPWLSKRAGTWLVASEISYSIDKGEVVVRRVPAGHYRLLGPVGDELLVEPLAIDLASGTTHSVTMPVVVGRRCRLSFEGESGGKTLSVAVRSKAWHGELRRFEADRDPATGRFSLEAVLPRGAVSIEGRSDKDEVFRADALLRGGSSAYQRVSVPRV